MSFNKAVFALSLLIVASLTARAQAVPQALDKMESANYAERRAGFYQLVAVAISDSSRVSYRTRYAQVAAYAKGAPEIRTHLIALLERENATASPSMSEDRYPGDLIAAVAALNDPRAVAALIGAVNTGWIAIHGLAHLGDAAVDTVIAVAVQTSNRARIAALLTLAEMVTSKSPRLELAKREHIRAVLLRALHDLNRFARQAALDGLVAFNDSESIDAVRTVAATDAYMIRDGGRLRYPVRELATKTLEKQVSGTDQRSRGQ